MLLMIYVIRVRNPYMLMPEPTDTLKTEKHRPTPVTIKPDPEYPFFLNIKPEAK
jgi:hypothetical protein